MYLNKDSEYGPCDNICTIMYLAIIACHLAFILIKFGVKKKMNAQVKIDFHLTSIFMVKLFLALLLITLIKIRGLNT